MTVPLVPGDAGARLRRAGASPWVRRVSYGFLGLVVLFLWWNAVRRGLAGPSSQINDFVRFGRDLVLRGVNVYEAYEPTYTITKYPPFFGLFFAPLAFLPMALAASLWFWTNLALSVLAARAGASAVAGGPEEVRERPLLAWLPYMLIAPLIISNLETGQINIVIVALVCWGLLLFTRERDWASGLVLGLATALKLTPALFGLYFLAKREWRVVAGMSLGVFVAWVVLPLTAFGWDGYRDIYGAWLEDVSPFIAEGIQAEGEGGFRHTNQSLSAVLHRTLADVPAGGGRENLRVNVLSLRRDTVTGIVRALDILILLGLVWMSRARIENRRDPRLGLEYALVVVATLFLSPISWINHYVLLLLPYLVAVRLLMMRPSEGSTRGFLAVATWTSFVLLLTSVSRLLQAFSLPFLGALVLSAGLAATLVHVRRNGGAPAAPCEIPPQLA